MYHILYYATAFKISQRFLVAVYSALSFHTLWMWVMLLAKTLHMEAAYTSKTWATPPTDTWCQHTRAEPTSILYYILGELILQIALPIQQPDFYVWNISYSIFA
jgi:hypothetical protein